MRVLIHLTDGPSALGSGSGGDGITLLAAIGYGTELRRDAKPHESRPGTSGLYLGGFMDATKETDMGNDERLVEALRSLSVAPTFSIGAEIAKAAEQWNQGARVADDCFCRGCGRRGIQGYCQNCERG